MSDRVLNIADLRAEIASADAKAAFDVIVEAFSSLSGFAVAAHEQGFLNSLRVRRGEEFCFAGIPNEDWVLAYIRKPELRRGRIKPELVFATFPEARLTSKGEITLRIHDLKTAKRWIEMIQAADQS